MIRPALSLAITASLIFSLLPRFAVAAAGDLDPSFGAGGKTQVAIPGMQDLLASAVVRDAAGRIYLIASKATDGPQNPQGLPLLTIARLHHDGALDVSYGIDGYATTVLPARFDKVSSAVMQPDGRIVLGFHNYSGLMRLLSCRVSINGVLDVDFGDAESPGCANVGPDETFSVRAIALQPDGHIVLAGTAINVDGVSYRGFAARLTSTGQLASDFGEGGIKLLGGNTDTSFNDIAFAPDGDLILAGDIFLQNSDFLIARLDGETGQGVPGFGSFALVVGQFEAGAFDHDSAYAVDVLPDGDIVAAGYAQTDLPGSAGMRPAVLKLDSAGKPEESFGPGGKRVYDPCPADPQGCENLTYDMAALPGERLVIAGSIRDEETDNENFLAMRILPNGMPDSSFGVDPQSPGTVVVPFDLGSPEGSGSDSGTQVLPEGERLLLIGTVTVATDPDNENRDEFGLARLDHGIDAEFDVTPKPGPHGELSPSAGQQIGHSDRAEFVVLPNPGYVFDRIEKGPGYCDGGMDGEVFVSAPVTQPCEVHVSFKRSLVFADGYE